MYSIVPYQSLRISSVYELVWSHFKVFQDAETKVQFDQTSLYQDIYFHLTHWSFENSLISLISGTQAGDEGETGPALPAFCSPQTF
ncbi:MAG: hypothetical protein LBQ24_03645 [Candidatus Peribacteria bacterium]|nr:hypothetical protein [Candidatus Peribacteria bacterium]